MPPVGGPAAGAPVVALDALPGGALDVVGEEVTAAGVAHVEAAQVEEGLADPLPLVGVVDLAGPAEELGLAGQVVLVGERRDDAAARVAPEVLGLHGVRHAAHVEAAVAEERLPRR